VALRNQVILFCFNFLTFEATKIETCTEHFYPQSFSLGTEWQLEVNPQSYKQQLHAEPFCHKTLKIKSIEEHILDTSAGKQLS
jgi:hypothetical protein